MMCGIKIWLIFLIFFSVAGFSAGAQEGIEKKSFYKALASGSISVLDKQKAAARVLRGNDKSAFEGALLMRKSGLLKVPAQKLSMFKQGHKLLEDAISKEPANTEYRFLRLMIQENAPKIVGYSKNIEEDVTAIKNNYKLLPAEAQEAILAYSRSSKILTGLK